MASVDRYTNNVVRKHLIEIFKVVADVMDGGEESFEDIREAYEEAMKQQEMLDFYGDLVDERHEAIYGSSQE